MIRTLDPEALALAERAYSLLVPLMAPERADAEPTTIMDDPVIRARCLLADVCLEYAEHRPADLAAMLLRYRAELEGGGL